MHVHNFVLQKKQAGCTALIYAANEDHTAMVLALVEAGADTNIRNEVRLCTCMLLFNKFVIVVIQKKQDGATALIYAAGRGHTAMVQALVEAGADINIQGNVRSSMYLSNQMKQTCLYEISQNISHILLDCI